MLNLDPNDAVHYTREQEQSIDYLINNNPGRNGTELWKEDGPHKEFVEIKKHIRTHYLKIQRLRCVFCERLLVYGDGQIEHFAPKWNHKRFLYEPLNLTCSCNVCNNFSNKGNKETIEGNERMPYRINKFKYVHPFLDDVDREIKYKDPFKIFIDKEHSSEIGKATIDLFHWDNDVAASNRFINRLYWCLSPKRRRLFDKILNYED